MQVHGFARNMQWECTVASLDECVMTLLPNDESRKMWPHEFKVTQTICLKGGGLTATLAVRSQPLSDCSQCGSLFPTWLMCSCFYTTGKTWATPQLLLYHLAIAIS